MIRAHVRSRVSTLAATICEEPGGDVQGVRSWLLLAGFVLLRGLRRLIDSTARSITADHSAEMPHQRACKHLASLKRASDVGFVPVGDTGIEPVTSSV
jgi:hypothetical protein